MNSNSQLRRPANGYWCLFFLTQFLCFVPPAVAQRSQSEIALELARRMDTNRDGLLQESEIPRQSRRGVLKLAREAGLDTDRPISIDRLRKYLKKGKSGQPQRSANSDSAETTVAAPKSSQSTTAFGRKVNTSETRGFGDRSTSQAVPAQQTEDAKESDQKKDKNEVDPKEAKNKEKASAKIREFAKGRMKQFDKNRNGVLEKDEWGRMRGDPQKADTNNDGILTTDELVVDLTNYGNEPPSRPKTKKPTNGKKRRKSSQRGNESRETYRFLTPTERLSESMPRRLRDWFLETDENGDGQVAMSEFASFWSSSKAAEFIDLDQNNDGVITPAEYIAASEAESK